MKNPFENAPPSPFPPGMKATILRDDTDVFALTRRQYESELRMAHYSVGLDDPCEPFFEPAKKGFDLKLYDPEVDPPPTLETSKYFIDKDGLWYSRKDGTYRSLCVMGLDYGLKIDSRGQLYFPKFRVFQPGFVSDFDILHFDPDRDLHPIWHETGYYVEDGEVWQVKLEDGAVLDRCLTRGVDYGL